MEKQVATGKITQTDIDKGDVASHNGVQVGDVYKRETSSYDYRRGHTVYSRKFVVVAAIRRFHKGFIFENGDRNPKNTVEVIYRELDTKDGEIVAMITQERFDKVLSNYFRGVQTSGFSSRFTAVKLERNKTLNLAHFLNPDQAEDVAPKTETFVMEIDPETPISDEILGLSYRLAQKCLQDTRGESFKSNMDAVMSFFRDEAAARSGEEITEIPDASIALAYHLVNYVTGKARAEVVKAVALFLAASKSE